MRVAAIQVSHWHSLYDAAYLKNLTAMPDVEIVGLHDSSAAVAAKRAAALGGPPTFTDYPKMLAETRPDFVIALGRHCDMADIAHHLLDEGYPFMMEKPMGLDARQVERIADKAAARGAWVAVPLAQRYQPFTARAKQLLADGSLGPVSHFYFRLNRPTSARYPAWDSAWMLDPALAGGGCLRNLGTHGLDLFLHLTGEDAEVTGAQLSGRGLGQPVEDYASVLLRSASGVLGTIEVGNLFPRDGTDGEWKIAGRDGILTLKDGTLRLATASGDETAPGDPREPLYVTALRDLLDRWRRGLPPPVGVAELARAVKLIDQRLRGGLARVARGRVARTFRWTRAPRHGSMTLRGHRLDPDHPDRGRVAGRAHRAPATSEGSALDQRRGVHALRVRAAVRDRLSLRARRRRRGAAPRDRASFWTLGAGGRGEPDRRHVAADPRDGGAQLRDRRRVREDRGRAGRAVRDRVPRRRLDVARRARHRARDDRRHDDVAVSERSPCARSSSAGRSRPRCSASRPAACFGVSRPSASARASISLAHPSAFVAAAFTLVVATATQTAMMGTYLALREPGQLRRVFVRRAGGALVGATSALGSASWFTAFTLQIAAYVRTLGLVELVFTLLISLYASASARRAPS